MFDLTSQTLLTNLAEAVRWCAAQPTNARLTNTAELQLRQTLLAQSGGLMRRAYASRDRFWNKLFNRDYTKTLEWKASSELLRQAEQHLPVSLADELRSAALKPDAALAGARTDEDRANVVRSVIAKRSELLKAGVEAVARDSNGDLYGGRLLLYVPEENLADGAAESMSNRFFDVENCPPWDTWVTYSDSTLLSWVPPELVPLAQRGIDVNPEQCIRWMHQPP